jgi:hypothetical protein
MTVTMAAAVSAAGVRDGSTGQLRLEPRALLADHAAFIGALPCNGQAKRLRQRGAKEHLSAFPDLLGWMSRPTTARVAEARRYGSWPFLSWCFATERLRPDVGLLALKGRGCHFLEFPPLAQRQHGRPGGPDRAPPP